MTPIDTPEYCPPRYCVKLKHKMKGRNTVYKSTGGIPNWLQWVMIATVMFSGGLFALWAEVILKRMHWISPF